MFLHFKCFDCGKIYAVKMVSGVDTVAPKCPRCHGDTIRSGTGSTKIRGVAILLTPAALDRYARPARSAAEGSEAKTALQLKRKRVDDSSSESSESEDESDDDYLPQPPRPFNVRMRLTIAAYQARGHHPNDVACVLRQTRNVLTTAGRLDLNKVMGQHLPPPALPKWPAWRHHGTTSYATNPKASSEWCHLVADSLGGPSIPANLVAASYSANTYMCAMEVMLKGQGGLTIDVTVHCSVPHFGEWIYYRILQRASNQSFLEEIDAQATGFAAADLTDVQTRLQAWLAARGIVVARSP